MRIITAAEIEEHLTFRDLVEALRTAFRSGVIAPSAERHVLARPDGADAMLSLMPAWTDFEAQGNSRTGYAGVKIASVFPDNARRDRPTGMGVYVLMSGHTGEPLAVLDGRALTVWRTAAASALAASYLAREDASRLLMVGAGALAPYLIEAHAAVRPISEVLVWNRDPDRARRLAAHIQGSDYSVSPTEDLEGAARGADLVSCATLATEPLIQGEWLSDGCHLDLVGGYRPDMREGDDICIERARIFVDTREGTMTEAGDIMQPLENGSLRESDITADLFELCRGQKAGRRYYNQITLFKSVGTALEDLTAAQYVFSRS